MSNYDVEKIRNVAVIAHGGAGKTSLVEAVLYDSKSSNRLGTVEAGNTVTDYEPEEVERKISISSATTFCEWNGYRINIIDTPGYISFLEDTRGCLSIADGAVVIVSALSGVKAETEKIWQFACKYEIPRVIFVNKMDRENASFDRAVGEIEKSFESSAIPLNIPIGSGEGFEGVIDIIKMKAIHFGNGSFKEGDIPEELKTGAEEYRKKLVEKIAESDDSLLEKYLEGGELTDQEILKGIREGSITRRFVPVICGSAVRNLGIQQLLDTVALCLPSPAEKANITPISGTNPKSGEKIERKPVESDPLSAQVFKTIADPFAGKLTIFRVFSGVLKADANVFNSTRETKEKLGSIFYLQGKKQIPVQKVGPGEIAAVAKLKETMTGDTISDAGNPILLKPISFSNPMISYAIAPKSRGDEDKVGMGFQKMIEEDPTLHFSRDAETKEMILSGMGQLHLEVTLQKLNKKQSGGRGQYGDCWIEIKPMARGENFEFINKIVGGVIPRQYIPAIEKGILETMKGGIMAGYPMVDIQTTVYDGSYHSVDSSEMAFKIAGSMALKKAVQVANAVLLEPIMKMNVITPDEFLGGVIGDLNSKRGKVQGVEPQSGNNQSITALVPMAEMLTYANQLNSITSGRAMYSMEFSHYEEVPSHLAQKIIAEREKEKSGE
jgi:elongation factor G